MSMQPFPDPLGVLPVMKRPEKPSVQEKRHLSYATRLRDDGITFKVAHEAERIGVGKLVRQTIPGSESATISSDEAVLAAAHDGHVIAGVVAGLTDHQTVRMMVIRAVAVDENWRGQGVGLVMLNMIPQMLQMYGVPAPVIACGGCDPASVACQEEGTTGLP